MLERKLNGRMNKCVCFLKVEFIFYFISFFFRIVSRWFSCKFFGFFVLFFFLLLLSFRYYSCHYVMFGCLCGWHPMNAREYFGAFFLLLICLWFNAILICLQVRFYPHFKAITIDRQLRKLFFVFKKKSIILRSGFLFWTCGWRGVIMASLAGV